MSESRRLEEAVDFADNSEPRCPCILLLDVSGSMGGAPIKALNDGLHIFRDDLNKDGLTKKRVEVAIVTFESTVKVVQDFVTADKFQPPTLDVGGATYMGAGIDKALDILQARKASYKANAINYYRPWIFMITDGSPSDNEVVNRAAQRIRDEEARKKVAFFAVGVEGVNMTRLSQIVVRPPMKLTGLNFEEMFQWLSASMSGVSHSQLDEQVPLQKPGWGSV
ncbi:MULTISPECIES: VWA domain-containing protein [unclassified Microcoleus]|uniref:VWA domain-containing protein n=1 Tax=unclassified Microcoleus TaxID=2642155 RepID=UPI002FD6969C